MLVKAVAVGWAAMSVMKLKVGIMFKLDCKFKVKLILVMSEVSIKMEMWSLCDFLINNNIKYL